MVTEKGYGQWGSSTNYSLAQRFRQCLKWCVRVEVIIVGAIILYLDSIHQNVLNTNDIVTRVEQYLATHDTNYQKFAEAYVKERTSEIGSYHELMALEAQAKAEKANV